MNLDQLRIELWDATVNAKFFTYQRGGWVAVDWGCKILLAAGTVLGVIPLLKGFEEYQYLSWISVISGTFGIIVLPLFGLGRGIELMNCWRGQWIDLRSELLTFYRSSSTTGNVATAKAAALQKKSTDIEKDVRCFLHIPFLQGLSERAAKNNFELWNV